MATVEELVEQQLTLIRSVSNAVSNFKKLGQARMTSNVAASRMERVKEQFREIRANHAKLIILADVATQSTHPYFIDEQFLQAEGHMDAALDYLTDFAVPSAAIPHISIMDASHSSNDYRVGPRPVSRLPRIDLPKFDGSFERWETFRDRFRAMVIDDPSLTNVERLHYLCSVVTGTAATALSHLAVTDANFEVAWQILSSRYENQRRIVNSHLQTLFSLPSATHETAKELQTLRDTTNSTIQALKNLKRPVDAWDDVLVFLVSQKLDKASRKAWELKMSETKELPSYSQLDKFLESRIRAFEVISPIKTSEFNDSTASKSKAAKSVASHATALKFECPVCKNNHRLFQCTQFAAYTPERRFEFIKSNRRCFNCLAANHSLKDCTNEHRCRECKQKHHSLLHLGNHAKLPCAESSNSKDETKTDQVNGVVALTASHTTSVKPAVLLATARVRVHSAHGRFVPARALIDQGSAATLITENLAQLLRLPRTKQNVSVTGIAQTKTSARYAADINISSATSNEPSYSTTALILPSLTQYVPSHVASRAQWTHLSSLELADTDFLSPTPIDLIIGADLYGIILRDGLRKGAPHEPIAQNTAFGWILSGPTVETSPRDFVSAHHTTISHDLDHTLKQFWELEDIPDCAPLSPEDVQCEEHFLATHYRTNEGRYVVRLPFRNGPPTDLGDSRTAAFKSLERLERRFQRDQSLAAEYTDFLDEYEHLGHMTKIQPTDSTDQVPAYYIPHHAVIRDYSHTTRLRVVFNASCNTAAGKSLNSSLHVGAKLQTDLIAVVLQWRQYRYVLSADIAKMYRQILVHPVDTKYQCILWRSSPSAHVDEYRLLTVTYGTAAAPFLALRVLRQLAEDEGSQFPLALPVLLRQTYVDDCTFGADDLETAKQTRDQLISLLSRGCFRLRKWASNCPTLLDDLDPSDHGLATNKDLHDDDSLKILGVTWKPESDTFTFRVSNLTSGAKTKREILAVIARLFDPLGWVAPVIVTAKIFLQCLWLTNCKWDDEIPTELLKKWEKFQSDLPLLEQLTLPRWTQYQISTSKAEFHGFADASTRAYAAALYIRVISSDGRIANTLLLAKSKVAPLKTISVPRLELCAALLLAHLIAFARSALQLPDIDCWCWTDSMVVLAWVSQNPSRWKTFVANRVSKIQQLLPDAKWNHVPTQENPADCASRGTDPDALASHKLWWQGPLWLSQSPNHWPTNFEIPMTQNEQRESKSCATCVVNHWDLESRFSSWPKLLRVTGYILRFVRNAQAKTKPPCDASHLHPHALRADEFVTAHNFWIRQIQSSLFTDDITRLKQARYVSKTSTLASLSPYLDQDGLLRVRGRLKNANLLDDAKYPLILKSHPLVHLLIKNIHVTALHTGPQLTLTLLRQKYWLIRARATVRAVLYQCTVCARENARVPEQLMGDLPDFRVNPTSRAFIHTGVDYAGPLLVRTTKGRGYKAQKAYLSIFVCMTTKALHLEVVSDYSTASFLAAYHRFTARRGVPHAMYSDHGTTFQGADRELTASFHAATRDPTFQNYIAQEKTAWHFIPPAAPHFGGLWEAAVRCVKYHLKRAIGAHTLTFEELTTLLCRIELFLNSRPIASVSDALDDYAALTPGHFLIGAPLSATPEPSVLELAETRLSRWQLVQQLSERVWKAWKNTYLHTLQQRPKWRFVQNLATPGRLVLLRDPLAPPSRWKLGRIIKCHPGSDRLVRVVTVKTADSEFKRPITKICFLPVDINNESERHSATAGGINM